MNQSEAGDTLVEILVAIVIIALTVTALLGALVTAITSSTTEQSLSTVDSVLNSFAQSAQYEIQQLSSLPNWNCRTNPYRLRYTLASFGSDGVVFYRLRDGLRRQHGPRCHPDTHWRWRGGSGHHHEWLDDGRQR